MARRHSYHKKTAPFLLQGEEQFVQVLDNIQTIQRCRYPSSEVVEETKLPVTRAGCYIDEMAASPSGAWLVTMRISGQGEWGYDVFRSQPLARVAGVAQERGYILELPKFSADESFLVGGAGPGFLGEWWVHPEDEVEDPARGGPVSLGFLFIHKLPSHEVSRHELRVELPAGWQPEDPWAEWYGPSDIAPTSDGVRMLPSWGVPVEVKLPLPPFILLPVPSPSGQGIL